MRIMPMMERPTINRTGNGRGSSGPPQSILRAFLILIASLIVSAVHAANLTPILISDGTYKLPCDGTMHFINTTPLQGKQIVSSYLFANLITSAGNGVDIILWSPSYGPNYPPPWPGGSSSQWGTVGDLHTVAQPAGHTGGRQGESYRSFQPDGILVNDHVQIAYVCWGGGTVEIYAQVWIRDAL